MEEKGLRISLAVFQSFLVIVLAYLLSFIKETDIVNTSIIILFILHFFVFYISDNGNNFFKRGYLAEFISTIKYSVFFALAISVSNFFLEERFSISRRGMIYFLTVHFVLLYLLNLFIKHYWKRLFPNFKGRKKVFLITATSRTEKVMDRLIESSEIFWELEAVSVLDKPNFRHEHLKVIPAENILDYTTHEVVDEVFINLPSEEYNIEDYISLFETMGIDVTVNLNAFNDNLGSDKKIREMAGLNVITFSTKFYKLSHVIAKRLMDIIGSIIGLVICGIVAIFLVPQIKKDGGPAIFAQNRVGKNGRIFKFYKFRSMYIDAEERKQELMAHNTMSGGMFKMDNDPRVTPIGRFIRKTSLDELPQFWNVLRGDMSLVGTRPPTVDEYEKYTPEQKKRLSFKPGITGLWQVSGRSEITDFDEVVKLDVSYIDEWTIWSDIKILLKTIKVVFMRDGAK